MYKKNVLVLYAGPRLNKNTDKMLKIFLNNLNNNNYNINRIDLKNLSINLCDSCYYCAKYGKCIKNDDMNKIYAAIESSDIVILSSPMYFNSISSLAKIMIDRCQVYWSKKFVFKQNNLKPKIGILLMTAGAIQKNRLSPGATMVVDLFFKSINANFEHFFLIENLDKIKLEENVAVINELIECAKNL